MHRWLLLLLLFPWTAPAQFRHMYRSNEFSDTYLREISWLMRVNREPGMLFFGNPNRELASLDTLPQTGENVHRRAVMMLIKGDYTTAIKLYEQSTQLDPKQHGSVGWMYLMSFRDYTRALRHYEAYDALTPNFDDTDGISPVSYMKALAWRGMGNHAEAVAQFSIGIDQLEAKHGAEWVNYKHYVSRAISLLALGRASLALTDLDKAAQNNKQSMLVQYYRGQAFTQLNRPNEAQNAYRDALFFFRKARADGRNTTEDYTNGLSEESIEQALNAVKP